MIFDSQEQITHTNAQFQHYVERTDTELNGMSGPALFAVLGLDWQALYDDGRLEAEYRGRFFDVIMKQHNTIPGGLTLVFREVTDHVRTRQKLAEQVTQLSVLRRVHDEVTGTLDVQTVLMLALDAALRLSGAHTGGVGLRNEQTGMMEQAKVIGGINSAALSHMLTDEQSIISEALRKMEPTVFNEFSQTVRYRALLSSANELMVVPLVASEERVIGVLVLAATERGTFSESRCELLQLLSNRLAVAIENARLYRQVSSQLEKLQASHQRISELEQLKTDMIRMAAHDLGAPLSVIDLRVNMFRRLPGMTDEQKRLIGGIEAAAEQMRQLTQNILSLEKIEYVAKHPMRSQMNLRRHMYDLYAQYRGQAADANIDLSIVEDNGGKAVYIWGQRNLLNEAMSNLIGNAIKYTEAGGTVKLSLTTSAGKVMFCVTDTGVGVAQEDHARLFQPFSRIENEETAHVSGSGLGLYLVKRIVERHDGKMVVKSERGVGSTFGFWLPLPTKESV